MAKKIKPMTKLERLTKFANWMETYEKNPPEIIKDDFAYDRFLLFFHECGTHMKKIINGEV